MDKQKFHAIQFWIALPEDKEECEPSYQHAAQASIPEVCSKRFCSLNTGVKNREHGKEIGAAT
jgi:redox-sensitive bicupin YhaK (pirin superfamily)